MGDYIRDKRNEGLYRAPVVRSNGLGNYGADGLGIDIPDTSTLLNMATGAAQGGGRALKEAAENAGDSLTNIARKYENQAKAFYEEISKSAGNQNDADVAQRFFLRGLDVLDRSISYAQQAGFSNTAAAAQAVEGTRDALMSGFKLAGEGGTLDKIKAADTLIKATLKIADAFGADKTITKEISAWAEIGTSCASMIVSSGPMWYLGAAGCAAQTLLKVLSMTAPAAVGTPPGIPSAYFKLVGNPPGDDARPEITQTTIVMRDAILLAQVLKSHYGLTSLRPLYDALTWNSGVIYTLGDGPEGDGLWGRASQVFRSYSNSFLDKSMPAVDLTSMLLAVAALDRTEPTSVDATQTDLVQIASRVCEREWDECCHCDINWNCGAKIQYTSHEHFLGVQWYAKAGELNQAGVAVGASIGRGRVAKGAPIGSLLKFVRVDELINYFYAVSLNTRRQDEETWKLEVRRFLMPSIPVQFYFIPEAKRASLWSHTNIMCEPAKCGSPGEFYIQRGDSAADDLRWRIWNDWSGDDVEAQREYAALRLMAAMSYLIRADRSAYQFEVPTTDPIVAGGPVKTLSVAWQAEMPIDPRQVVQTSPGVYIPNTWDGGHPWDPNMGAEVKTYPIAPFGSFVDPTAGVHYGAAWRSQTTRDGRWLARAIVARENHYRDLITRAFRAAAEVGTAAATKSLSLISSKTMSSLLAPTTAKMQALFQDDPRFQMKLATQLAPEFKANCEKGGGYVSDDGYCKPTAATEAACRANGGTPYWDPDVQYRCLAPGEAPPTSKPMNMLLPGGAGSGGGAGGIVILAGAALLLAKLMK